MTSRWRGDGGRIRAWHSPHKRQQAPAKLLDDPAEERGSLDAPEDESEIARYMRLLGSNTGESGEFQAGSVAVGRLD
jgi:hypothetical protein